MLAPTQPFPVKLPPLVAVDLEAGEILWRSTLGTWDRSLPPPMVAPVSLPLPLPWGTPTFGGPIITAGGHSFVYPKPGDQITAFALPAGSRGR